MRIWTFLLLRLLLDFTSDRSEIYRAISVIRSVCLAFLVTLVFLTVDLVHGQYLSVSVLIFMLLNFLFVFFLTLRGFFDIAKYIFIISISTGHFINAANEGRESGNILLYFPFLCAIILFFGFKNKMHVYILACYLVLQILVLEHSNFKLVNFHENPTSQYLRLNYSLLLAASLVLCMQFVRELSIQNRAAQAKLILLNKRMKRKNELLQKKNSELDYFVHKVSHDMRSPLRSVLGLTKLMKNESDISQLKEYVAWVEKSTQKLDSFVLEVLEMAKNAKSELSIKPIEIETFVKDVFEKLKHMDIESPLEFNFSSNTTIIYSDPTRLSHIVSNLLGNSIKYSKKDKNIACKISLEVHSEARKTVLIFEDNGQGIDEKYLPHIFEMFFRANSDSDGSGLGLFLVKETVNKLRGEITIASEIGIGTKMTVSIPNQQTV